MRREIVSMQEFRFLYFIHKLCIYKDRISSIMKNKTQVVNIFEMICKLSSLQDCVACLSV